MGGMLCSGSPRIPTSQPACAHTVSPALMSLNSRGPGQTKLLQAWCTSPHNCPQEKLSCAALDADPVIGRPSTSEV